MSDRQALQLLLEQQRSAFWKATACCIIACVVTGAAIVWAASRDHTQLEILVTSHKELKEDVTTRLRALEIALAAHSKNATAER